MKRNVNDKESRQDEFDKMLEEAMKEPGVAMVMELMERLRKNLGILEEFEEMTAPIIITTTSAGTDL